MAGYTVIEGFLTTRALLPARILQTAPPFGGSKPKARLLEKNAGLPGNFTRWNVGRMRFLG
jgi:hypothetical protein